MATAAGAGQASLADILAIEQCAWPTPGAKAGAILDRLGITQTRYYQLLNEAIDTPEALRADPALVNRLRGQRARRLARRTGPDSPDPAVMREHCDHPRLVWNLACALSRRTGPRGERAWSRR